VRSMTGYGAGAADAPSARISVEIRGVNQRHLDVKIAAPREYAAWEAEVRDRVRTRVERGRVDVTVVRTPVTARRRYRVAVREDLARAYVEAARGVARKLGLAGEVGVGEVMRLPELFEVVERAPDLARELPAVKRALGAALTAFDRERRREGRHLRGDMQRRVRALRRLSERIRGRLPQIERQLRKRVEERIMRLGDGVGVDPARLAQELASLAERSDVTEELVRLDGHLAAIDAALRGTAPAGKRIEFLLQEVLRELNTTGAKVSDLAASSLVLEAKGEVEKLREQVQNVE
jgi:uncharacterized protein (TIGR00255 family)